MVLCLAASPAAAGAGGEVEILLPDQVREGPIAAKETRVYRVTVADAPLLIAVEQRGIDLVVEAQGPAARLVTDARCVLWGSEILLLESPGEHRIEIYPRDQSASPGQYIIRAETLPSSADDRRATLSLMNRAGQEVVTRTPETRRRAIAFFLEALKGWHTLGERRWEAETLDAIAALEGEDRDLRPAAEHYSQALAIWQELADSYREAATLNELGLARVYMGEIEPARETWSKALALWQSLGEHTNEVLARGSLCFVEQVSGKLSAALACYEEPLALYRDLGDQGQEVRILNNIGGIYFDLGEPDPALERFEQALAVRRTLADHRGEEESLTNIAAIHRGLGEWQEAFRLFGQVREILASFGDRWQEAALLSNVGVAYNSLGEPQRALSFLEDALKLRREIGDQGGEIGVLNNLGEAWRKLGDPEKGLDHHRHAFEQAVVLGDARQQALTRLRLGEAQLERNDPAAAFRELDPALAYLKEMGLRPREAQALQLRARALAQAGRLSEARPAFQDVLALRRALHDRAGEAETLQALAATERSLGLRDDARAHVEAAVARVEELRTGFVNPDLRAAFLATQRRAYSLLIDLMMDGGHDREALAVSERARARSLLDVLGNGTAVRAGNAVPAKLVEQRQSLHRRLSAKADLQLKQSGARAEALGKESEELLAELDSVEGEIRRLDPRYAAVSEPHTLGVEDVAKLLEPDTLLLEYSLGEERSYLWAIDAGSFRSFVLPPQREIEALARRLYGELSTLEAGAGGPRNAATVLSRILLRPVASAVARSRRLVIVPDAALHLLPFGALPAPGSGQPLLEQVEIAYLPSATTLALQRQRLERRASPSRWAAVIADPVFTPDDPRVAHVASLSPSVDGTPPSVAGRPAEAKASRSTTERSVLESTPLPDLERLPATLKEAQAITTLAPAGQVWTASGVAASREAVLSGGLRDYRVVHFATHGLADTRRPELSGLVLSLVDAAGQPREGFLSLSDIYELDLDADLVVLSGCRTALGKEVRGEGLMGLTRGFLYAGVPRVVATLWKVQDRATAKLMSYFYSALWRDRLPPAAALRQAQRRLRQDRRYRDPYSWAGFVLQGDWR
jgi:CHAT domain-containing protein/tetratricopeptide (TPR) repeat protein